MSGCLKTTCDLSLAVWDPVVIQVGALIILYCLACPDRNGSRAWRWSRWSSYLKGSMVEAVYNA